ncbi:SUKH-4 family immunity protein [Streptomyces niveus]|uniref:SUKH-4 family immunity protein n=1 Tax=Streptomyces niveus TaxID=193462 RepID=UPI00369DA3AE
MSSLAYTIYAVKQSLPHIASLDTFDERNSVIQSVRQEIATRDPLPFAHEDGEWNAAVEEIAMGMWT